VNRLADRRAPEAASGADASGSPSASELEWLEYFDTLDGASRAVLDVPAPSADAPPVVFPMVTPPSLPMPGSLEERRAAVVRLLDRTTHEIERRQAEVARELAGLRARPTRSAYHADFGDALDLVG
jgi:hypothetical protein